MNEPVSSPSLLTITAPSKETPTKSPRAATEDFREQLNSVSKADESRSTTSKKKDVELEKSPGETSRELRQPETEQKANSPGEAVSSADQETTATLSNDKAIDTEIEESLVVLADGLVVTDQIIAPSILEEQVTPDASLLAAAAEEITGLPGKTPGDTSEQSAKLSDAENHLQRVEGEGAKLAAGELTSSEEVVKVEVSETIAASAEVVAKKTGEQAPAVPSVTVNEEEGPAFQATANDQSSGEEKQDAARPEPSLLAKANEAAIQEGNKEQSEANQPFEKAAPLPAAAAVVSAAEKLLNSDDSNQDTSEGTGRNTAAISGAEERANQRAELTAAAKTRTNSAPTIDPSRFVSRVSKAFEAAQQQGGGPIRMRLSPPELGMLQVQIEVKEGVLTASLEAETHAARNLLLENLPALRDRLAEQQISIEKFDVDVRDESAGADYEQADSRESDADAHEDRKSRRDTLSESVSNNEELTGNLTKPSTISFDDNRVDLVA